MALPALDPDEEEAIPAVAAVVAVVVFPPSWIGMDEGLVNDPGVAWDDPWVLMLLLWFASGRRAPSDSSVRGTCKESWEK